MVKQQKSWNTRGFIKEIGSCTVNLHLMDCVHNVTLKKASARNVQFVAKIATNESIS